MAKKIIVLLTLVSLTIACGGRADIRPEALQAKGPTSQQVEKGDALVAKMVKYHGIESWKGYNFMEARVQDEWFNRLFYALAAPYTENPERAYVASYTKRFPKARVEFLGGENRGEVWGVNGTNLVRKEAGESLESFTQEEEAFFATFVHNFLLWPNVYFQLATADKRAYLGSAKWEGKTYDRVLVSWGSFEPQEKVDQWELWLNQESGRLERVWFTIRLAGEDQQAGYNLRNFKEIQGMQIATTYEGLLEFDEEPLHTYTYTEVKFSNRQEKDLVFLK